MEAKQNICCFIGRRSNNFHFGQDEVHEDCIRLKIKMAVEIEKIRKKGVTTFLSGMAQGVDIWGAEIVLDLKRAYPDEEIRLIAVVPYKSQANRWPEDYRERYLRILASADETVILHEQYTRGCVYERKTLKLVQRVFPLQMKVC